MKATTHMILFGDIERSQNPFSQKKIFPIPHFLSLSLSLSLPTPKFRFKQIHLSLSLTLHLVTSLTNY